MKAQDFVRRLRVGDSEYSYVSLPVACEALGIPLRRLPFSLRVLLENFLRHADRHPELQDLLPRFAEWPREPAGSEAFYYPARVLLQDFTGVPVLVDLAALRSAMRRLGRDPEKVNPVVPGDLVVDHSIQVDVFGVPEALSINTAREYERNRERYVFLKWAQKAFRNLRIVPPASGIVHQVNLEYLARVVQERDGLLVPDTLIGTDSHTTMVNGLGVLGWGVGGIEAEAVLLGEPYPLLVPEVVGVRLTGRLPEGVLATDLVLTVTQRLRAFGVVGKFVEFFGPGAHALSLPDRATLANMAPEYGATMGFFPVDEETLRYLEATGRPKELVERVRAYCQAQGLWWEDEEPTYSAVLEIALDEIEPSLSGPARPHDRFPFSRLREVTREAIRKQREFLGGGTAVAEKTRTAVLSRQKVEIADGSIVIAAITSCTNTSNPLAMLSAGLVARKARARGLRTAPWVKTSLAPGSRVVTRYLREAGLLEDLEALGYAVVGYGCTTCIGNSGPLPEEVATAIREHELVVAAVLSGNRNFEGRIHPQVRLNFLASPPLVVLLGIVGTADWSPEEPVGVDQEGKPVYWRDLLPDGDDLRALLQSALKPEFFREEYGRILEGDARWKELEAPDAEVFPWDPASTYIREPPYFEGFSLTPPPLRDIENARVLMYLGDSVTTDHISPAGAIAPDTPAGKYLQEHGVRLADFNTYGARRGNHEVMIRGTFANPRIRNRLVPGKEGGWSIHFPTGFVGSVYEVARRYQAEGTPLLVLAGREYGSGSSRDWAAKGTALLGVRAVLASSFERIHRSNLIGMGVLPLELPDQKTPEELGLRGDEVFTIRGISDLRPGATLEVEARRGDEVRRFAVRARVDSQVELEYYRHGGILPYILRKLLS